VSTTLLPILANLALLALTVAVRTVTVNRLVKRKLLLAQVASSLALVAALAKAAGVVPPDLVGHVAGFGNLLSSLAGIIFVVISAINPLRENRIPDRFPAIVQDAIIVGLFAIVATSVLQEKFLTTSAVGAVVVGFALQDTLGNAFAGLAIQTEKPYRAGEWIRVGQHEGRVEEITWRATKIRTKSGTFVIVPNNVMSKEAIVNVSEPILPTRMTIDVGASYQVPPNDVKAAIDEAVQHSPLALTSPAPEVLLWEFGPSAIVYRARFWVEDYAKDEAAKSQVRTAIWYVFKRRHIEIPWPILVHYDREEAVGRPLAMSPAIALILARVDLLKSLTEAERLELAALCDERLFVAHEVVVRQGAPGNSMFVVEQGKLEVVLEPDGKVVAVTEAGGYFGEMSLLTGSPRTATVRAVDDCRLIEITSDGFRRFVLEEPAVLDVIASAAIERRAEINRRRSEVVTAAAPTESTTSFLARVRNFLRIPASSV
jgi:small-conductance mechanosensitive channel/CRP-like cAMP-binding protein